MQSISFGSVHLSCKTTQLDEINKIIRGIAGGAKSQEAQGMLGKLFKKTNVTISGLTPADDQKVADALKGYCKSVVKNGAPNKTYSASAVKRSKVPEKDYMGIFNAETELKSLSSKLAKLRLIKEKQGLTKTELKGIQREIQNLEEQVSTKKEAYKKLSGKTYYG